jgi:4-hydroxy-tetrahydrodipicolinate synthase
LAGIKPLKEIVLSLPSDRFTGVLAAALTPLKSDLTPDGELMTQHSKWLLANGCDGLAILGTTGEANSFGLKERIGIIEELVDSGIPGEKLMPGTGACSVSDAVTLTKVAVDAGSRGVLMLPPFYYKNPSDEGLFAFFSEVIQKVSDERLKIYLYHFPQMSATPISFNLIEMLLKAYPDTVVGMKDSSGVLDNMTGAAKNFDDFCVLAGADDCLLPLLEQGGGGCITACANVAAPLLREVYDGFYAGKDASEANSNLVKVRQEASKFPGPSAMKALMARHSGNDDWLNIRSPLLNLDEEKSNALFAAFDSINYDIPSV